MPLHRRLPKRGFTAPGAHLKAEIRLSDLEKLTAQDIDVQVLKQAGLVGQLVRNIKVINSGELTRKVTLRGIRATAGARAAIEAAGDRKSTRLNSSHVAISYAVFCLKKKNTDTVLVM